ncbi:MAG TPA: NAD-dependent epimerase/dehydratase family protein [Herpetosiphonaceae bacterium]|nr:NAD-dependent epimerase/dehydratase family protein [Herpetosiphonaceae bacterium]
MTQVIFGTGPLGLAVMDELAARQQTVVLLNRSGTINEALPAGVSVRAADATDPRQVAAACAGAEAAYLCAMPPYTAWPEQFPPLIKGVIGGLAGGDTKLIYGDNLYMYGPKVAGGRLHEGLPDAATGPKGRTRAAMARLLLDAHAAGRIRVALGRAPDFYGPRVVNSTFGGMFVNAALAGKAPNLIGRLDQPHTYAFIRDFARGLVTLGRHERALGRAWHIPSAPTLTTGQLVGLFAAELGAPIKPRMAGKAMLTALGWFNPLIREIKEMYDSFANPYVVDHGQFAAEFGAAPTPHQAAVAETLAWSARRQKNV